MTRPRRTRHTRTSTLRLPSGTGMMHGWPSGVIAGSIGAFSQFEPLVRFLLPALRRHALVEVALRIHEADADERHAEVARFLADVAGEHAEAAGVDRQRLVQRELGGEVGDRAGGVVEALLPPRVARARARSSASIARVVDREEAIVAAAWSSSSGDTLRSISTGLCAVCRHSG